MKDGNIYCVAYTWWSHCQGGLRVGLNWILYSTYWVSYGRLVFKFSHWIKFIKNANNNPYYGQYYNTNVDQYNISFQANNLFIQYSTHQIMKSTNRYRLCQHKTSHNQVIFTWDINDKSWFREIKKLTFLST